METLNLLDNDNPVTIVEIILQMVAIQNYSTDDGNAATVMEIILQTMGMMAMMAMMETL